MKKFTILVWLFVAITLLIIGILGINLFDIIFKHFVLKGTILTAESPIYDLWLASTFPIYVQFFFFNLTNPTEFELGSRPIVSQIGPYTYRVIQFKTNISIDNITGLITYKQVKQYIFDRNLSIGSESDEITSVNLGYISIANTVSDYSWIFISLASTFLEKKRYKLCSTHSVKEMLWGYNDSVLWYLHFIDSSVPTKIGLYVDKNDTDDGLVTIDGGLNNPMNVGRILKYHGEPTLPCWKTPQANMINGSDGSLFHGFLQDNETIDVFSADICRSIRFFPVSQDVVEGIPVKKYLPIESTFESANTAPQNQGFCLDSTKCPKDGVMDLSQCQPNAPLVVSLPHLTHADPSYRSAVVGLHPSGEFNTTFMIEPTLGAVLRVAQKLQLNAIVKQSKYFKHLANVKDVFLPIAYLNVSVNVDEAIVNRVRWVVVILPFLVKVICSVLIVLSVLGIGLLLLYLHFCSRKKSALEKVWTDYSVGDTEPIMSAVG